MLGFSFGMFSSKPDQIYGEILYPPIERLGSFPNTGSVAEIPTYKLKTDEFLAESMWITPPFVTGFYQWYFAFGRYKINAFIYSV